MNISGGPDDPPTLDPALAADARSLFVVRQLFAGLVRLDDDLNVVPDLAAILPDVSPDGLVYTFTLRSGLVWPDGAALNASDVVYSLERATDPALAAGASLPAALYLNDIAGVDQKLAGTATTLGGVKAPDNHTVVITLIAPRSYFLQKLTVGPAFVVDRRNVAQGADWYKHASGAGPFRLVDWQPGQLIRLEPNPKYYGGAPQLAAVNILIGAAQAGGLSLYEAGGLDVTTVAATDVARVQEPSDPLHADLQVTPELSLTYLGFNTALPPFDDARVRQAFALALNRDKIARVMFRSSVMAAAGIVPANMPGWASDDAIPAQDGAAARQLLSQSRYAASMPRIVLYSPENELGLMIRAVIKSTLGVEIEVRVADWSNFLSGLDAHEYQAFVLSWGADWPDPSALLEALLRGGANNQFAFAGDGIDAALDRAAATLDPHQRAQLYAGIQQQALTGAPLVPLFNPVSYTLVRPTVHGLRLTALGILQLKSVSVSRE